MFISGYILIAGLINGICLSGIYILVALGLTLIISIMNILQFAHGEIYMIGAFITYFIVVKLGGNALLGMLIAMVMTGILGLILERFMFRPLIGKFLPVICAGVGAMVILQTSFQLGFGPSPKSIPPIWGGVLQLSAWMVPKDRLAAVLFSIILTAILFLFLKRSRYGQAMIATAQNREGALLMGINPNLMYAMAMVVGSALAAVAGGFGGSIFILDPFMGGAALIKGISIVVIGGMGSLMGVIIGGLILGLCDGIIALNFSSAAAEISPLILVLLILIFRPQGLFGHE